MYGYLLDLIALLSCVDLASCFPYYLKKSSTYLELLLSSSWPQGALDPSHRPQEDLGVFFGGFEGGDDHLRV